MQNNNMSAVSMPSSPFGVRRLSALSHAAELGRSWLVQELLARGDHGREEDSRALFLAARAGKAECVRLLIPSSDLLSKKGRCLKVAAIHGRLDCVRLLLPAMGDSPPSLNIFAQARQAAASAGQAATAQAILCHEESIAISAHALLAPASTMPPPRL